jgi:sugar lactone lactonase YvrE
MKKLILRLFVLVLVAGAASAGYVGFFGFHIHSVAYHPPEPPAMEGPLAVNERLRNAEPIGRGQIAGGEDVAVDQFGRVYSGSMDGRLYRATLGAAGWKTAVVADLGLTPYGLKFDAAGNLIVAHHARGLISIDPNGKETVLTDSGDGPPIDFNDLDIASDGKIYFSDASSKYNGLKGNLSFEYEILDGAPYGRLLVYDPADRSTKVLLKDLYYANGVALSENEDFVLVAETTRCRIARFWLKGDKAGTSDIFADNLPGLPDGVMGNGQGDYWVALPALRDPWTDSIHPYPFLKNLVTVLPASVWLRLGSYGLVLRLDSAGKIVESLHDPTGSVSLVTNAIEHDGYLYLGVLYGDSVWRVKLDSKPPKSEATPRQP